MKKTIHWYDLYSSENIQKVKVAYKNKLDPSHQESQLILNDLAAYCRVHRTSFIPNDPYQTAFNEGARDVFLHIYDMLNFDITQNFNQ
ncbi:MAG: hypothetical protein K1X44_07490 [Alphaproteobacteria bacterium]|nr:hypothetical protein [Alphaproteobacteria bacterium]